MIKDGCGVIGFRVKRRVIGLSVGCSVIGLMVVFSVLGLRAGQGVMFKGKA